MSHNVFRLFKILDIKWRKTHIQRGEVTKHVLLDRLGRT